MASNSLDVVQRRLNILLLVSEIEVKALTPIEANKVTTSLVPHIKVSQDLNIKKILGPTLFGKLMAEWKKNNQVAGDLPDGTASGTPPIVADDKTNYKELYNNLYEPLIWWSYVISLAPTLIKVGETGLLLRDTDNSISAGLEGLYKMVKEGEGIARSYTEDFQLYVEGTFRSNEDVQEESKDVGGAFIKVYVADPPIGQPY